MRRWCDKEDTQGRVEGKEEEESAVKRPVI